MSRSRHPATWDRCDLVRRLCHSLDVAARVVDAFAVDGFADPLAPESAFRPEKPVSETALLIYAASGTSQIDEVAERIDAVARQLVPHARSDRILIEMALHPSLCLHFAATHILLTRLGYPDPAFDEVLTSCLRASARDGHERAPAASIEQQWLVSRWTGEGRGERWRRDLAGSALGRPLDLLGGVREDGYAVTHLLMYCTDFGFQPGRLPRKRSIILDEASSLLATCLDTEDFDLAGEVLMAWPLTGSRWSAAATFGFRLLTRIEDTVGVLPGGAARADRLAQLTGDELSRYSLGTAYHTVYVMGLLCAAALLPGRIPPNSIPTRPADIAFVDRVLEYVIGSQSYWQAELALLSAAERASLGSLLLDIAIAQRCREREFEAVAELLSLAVAHGITGSPLCVQAAELIERLDVSVRVIAARREGAGGTGTH